MIKSVNVEEDVHRKLSVFKAERRLKSLSAAIAELLAGEQGGASK